jgi:hypothetical protein
MSVPRKTRSPPGNSRAGVNRRISSTTGDEGAIALIAPVQIAIVAGTAAAGITVARARVMALVRRFPRRPGMPDAFDRAPLR